MEFIELNSDIRETTGKCPAKAMRREGKVPAILYGAKTEPVMLSVLAKDVETAFKNSKTIAVFVNLKVDGQVRSAMVKEVQKDPLTANILHVDFLEVAMDEKILVPVPVVTTGKSAGVEYGGILQVIRRKLDVLCTPEQVPEEIVLDITELGMGQAIHVRDIELPGVEIPAEVNFTVVTVLAPKGVAVEGEEEEEEAEEA